jgi:hypothetical protein
MSLVSIYNNHDVLSFAAIKEYCLLKHDPKQTSFLITIIYLFSTIRTKKKPDLMMLRQEYPKKRSSEIHSTNTSSWYGGGEWLK